MLARMPSVSLELGLLISAHQSLATTHFYVATAHHQLGHPQNDETHYYHAQTHPQKRGRYGVNGKSKIHNDLFLRFSLSHPLWLLDTSSGVNSWV